MDVAIVLFTRDLRVHDNPVLAAACARARQVVPAFVVDPALAVPPNRARFLAQSLADLRGALRERGGDLLIRRGDPVAESLRLAADTGARAVFVADDVTRSPAAGEAGGGVRQAHGLSWPVTRSAPARDRGRTRAVRPSTRSSPPAR